MNRLFTSFSVFLLGMTGWSASLEAAAPAKLRALLVLGGCCHDYATQKEILKRGLENRAHLEVDLAHNPDKSTRAVFDEYRKKDWAKGYDVIIHDECSADVKDVPYVENILAAHRAGVPAVNLHCAMHSYRTGTDRWFEYLGLHSTGHGPQEPIAVTYVAKDHPVTAPLRDWTTIREELYNNVRVFDSATPLARGAQVVKNKDGSIRTNDFVVAWANLHHGTRIFSTTLGHNNETVADPRYLDLVTRGLLWACGKLNADYLKPAPVNEQLLEQIQKSPPKTAPASAASFTYPDNLAKGKPTSASSEERGKNNFAPHAVDGKRNTRWCASGGGYPQWWQVDLGGLRQVRSLRLTWESAQSYRYTIDASADGKEWKTVVDQSKNQADGQVRAHVIAALQTRHLRVNCLGSGRGGWASFWEFEAYETDTPPELGALANPAADANPDDPLQPAGMGPYLGGVKIDRRLTAKVFAHPPEVNYPTFVKATPAGVLFVSVDGNGSLGRDPNRGKILRCVDTDDDGVMDTFTAFVPNVDSPRGLEWDGEWLYCLHPPHIDAYRDNDGDGIADEHRRLVSDIAFGYQDRPADHTSNGITLGIDGWLYCAIGDFGFMKARGADGRELQLRGGGVVRVRLDGSGLEIYSRGTRNIYEVAMSPRLDGFARDNTNDGGGWDVRLHHFTGLDHHGYPSLYRHFNEEIVQPLADYGGGSGTGALWLDEPGFPKDLTDTLFTVDWGRGIFRHELEPNGATFKEIQQHPFATGLKPTDLDCDARGRLYLADWKNGSFSWKGPDVGFVATLQLKDWKPVAVPDFKKASIDELSELIASPSASIRKLAQRELLRRKPASLPAVERIAADKSQPESVRIAAIFTISQAYDAERAGRFFDRPESKILGEWNLRAYAVRALSDRSGHLMPAMLGPIEVDSRGPTPREELQFLRAIARANDGGRLAGDVVRAASRDRDPFIQHVAIHAAIQLKAADRCFEELKAFDRQVADPAFPQSGDGLFRVLQALHHPGTVDGLLDLLATAKSAESRRGALRTLARLYFTEGEWDGKSWGTRPDTTGPYYYRVTWAQSERILTALKSALEDAATDKGALLTEMARNQIDLGEFIPAIITLAQKDANVEAAAVTALLNQNAVPDIAVPLLAGIARNEQRDGEVRLRAAQALTRNRSLTALQTAFALTARAGGVRAVPHTRAHLENALLNSALLKDHAGWLLSQTESANREESRLAWSALFRVLRDRGLAAATRESIEAGLRAAELTPGGAMRVLAAIADTKEQSQATRVLAFINHPDAKVRQAAERAAGVLKLNTKDLQGPKVAEFKPADVVAQVLKSRGDPQLGEALFARQGCVLCHTVRADEPLKGPFLGNITALYRRKEITEAILTPSATLAQGFAAYRFDLKDGDLHEGFVTSEAADRVTIRNIAGQEIMLKNADIAKREKLEKSLMPEGLVAPLTIKELASLVDYLEVLGKQAQK